MRIHLRVKFKIKRSIKALLVNISCLIKLVASLKFIHQMTLNQKGQKKRPFLNSIFKLELL